MQTYTINKDQNKEIVISKAGEYLVELVGEGAQAQITGKFLVEKNNVLNINLVIQHKAPNTRAETLLKAAATDEAQVKLAAKIVVDKNCNGTNSFLTERVLLLSDKAKAEAIPNLEIESDDVKCSHAASVSNINEEQIFYLMSRGLSRQEAENMIVEGFLGK